MTFEDLKLKREFLNALEDQGFESPTPVQEKSISPILAGQDVIAIAQTGTGKTAAYLLPILQTVRYAQGSEPRALVLVPTKELVVQVFNHLVKFSAYTDIRSVALYGGIGPKKQIEELEKGIDLIVATPGRFLELYSKGYIDTKKIKQLVLDEADRMMDMGFMPQLRRIFEVIPQKRQNLLLSATFPTKVESLADEFLLWPTRIEVTPPATPVETVDQYLFRLPNFRSKLNMLMHLLEDEDMSRVIVFVRTKEYAENIARYLDRKNVGSIRSIHANKGQNSRINAFREFKEGDVRVLVTTDVSARGIDVLDVSHVVNYSVPRNYEDYVHRIGRTGRIFKTGTAISFVDQSEEYHIKKIEKVIRQSIPEKNVPAEVEIIPTEKDERQEQAREIDRQKRKENPDYGGAFHEKKRKPKPYSGHKKKRRR